MSENDPEAKVEVTRAIPVEVNQELSAACSPKPSWEERSLAARQIVETLLCVPLVGSFRAVLSLRKG